MSIGKWIFGKRFEILVENHVPKFENYCKHVHSAHNVIIWYDFPNILAIFLLFSEYKIGHRAVQNRIIRFWHTGNYTQVRITSLVCSAIAMSDITLIQNTI